VDFAKSSTAPVTLVACSGSASGENALEPYLISFELFIGLVCGGKNEFASPSPLNATPIFEEIDFEFGN